MTELPDRLRQAADAHRPDRDRILARVERAMAAAPPGRRVPGASAPAPWVRVTAGAGAVAGAILLGGLAVAGVTSGGTPASVVTSGGTGVPQPPPAAAGTSVPGAAHSTAAPHDGKDLPGHRPSGGVHATGRAAPPASATGSAVPPAGTGGGQVSPPSGPDGSVTSTGVIDPHSNPYWTESDVKLSTTRPLTSLTVELRIARTGGVANNSSFTSAPGTTAVVSVEGDQLVYRWTLDAGQTLAAGGYTFAGQFDHDEGDRDTGGDGFTVTADGPGGAVTEHGGF